jgi:hypothetical protein
MNRRRLWGIVAGLALAGGGLLPATAVAAPRWYVNGNLLASGVHVPVTIWGKLQFSSQAEGKITCIDVFAGYVANEGGVGKGAVEGLGSYHCEAPELEEALETAFKEVLNGRKVTVFASGELPYEESFKEAELCVESTKRLYQCTGAGERKTQEVLVQLRRRLTSFPWPIELFSSTYEGVPVTRARIGIGAEGKTCYPTERGFNSEGKEVQVPVSWEKVPSGCLEFDVIAPQIPDELVFYGSLEPLEINGAGNALTPSWFSFNSTSGLLVSSRLEAPETSATGELRFIGSAGQELIMGR